MSDVPDDYRCHGCGVTGTKLWRLYQTVAPKLWCAACAATHQGETRLVGDDGCLPRGRGNRRTDTIGWMVPAVPVVGEDAYYWGHRATSDDYDDAVAWWRQLPTRLP